MCVGVGVRGGGIIVIVSDSNTFNFQVECIACLGHHMHWKQETTDWLVLSKNHSSDSSEAH